MGDGQSIEIKFSIRGIPFKTKKKILEKYSHHNDNEEALKIANNDRHKPQFRSSVFESMRVIHKVPSRNNLSITKVPTIYPLQKSQQFEF